MSMRLLCILAAILTFCGKAAFPQSAESTLQQLNHRTFTATDGAPMDVNALAQTPDGILWIGSRDGLTRFDGSRFVSYPQVGEEPLQQNNIDSLFVSPDGSLWIGFRPVGVAVLKEGRVNNYSEVDGLPNGSVAQFAQDRQGGVWAATRTGLAHLIGKRWELVHYGPNVDSPYGVLVDREGTLWVAGTEGLFARAVGEGHFQRIDHRVYDSPLTLLVAGTDGSVWAASKGEVIRVNGKWNSQEKRVLVVRGISSTPLLIDRAGGLWGSNLSPNALLRMPVSKLAVEGGVEIDVQPERFNLEEGLRSSHVFALLEDRENNIWVGSNAGLHRFSHSNVVRDATPPCVQNVFVAAVVAAGDLGSLWMACNGSESYVDEVRNGQVVSHQITPDFTVAYRDSDGTVWFAGSTHLAHVEGHRIILDSQVPDFVRGRPAQALMRERDGTTWISFSRRGTFRVVDGRWLEYGGLSALPRGSAYALLRDSKGVLWFGYTNNRVARVEGNEVRLYDAHAGLQVGNVMSIVEKGGHLWVGGELGLARFNGSRFDSIRSASGTPFKGISGIVSARNGDLWINGTNGIVHVAEQEIQRLLQDSAHPVHYELFNYLDGVPGTAIQLRPLPSAIEATDGRIWFSTTGGVISIDPTRLARNRLAPPVKIWPVTSNGKSYPDLGGEIRLPIHTTELRIPYSAGSLSVPERVQFKYKLEGSDHDWQDVGSRREAAYTNLGPGHYTFRVTASNNDGVWNETGAKIQLSISPAFYQTIWFYGLCVLALLGMLAELYKLRMRQVAAQVRGRLEARLAERERIARELHDTLLQGVQGLIWRFQAVSQSLPVEHGRERMEEALDRADRLLAESRDRVKDLRPSPGSMAELVDALATEGEQLAQLKPANFRVTVQGVHRELHPIVREEGFLIAREAIGNAFQHSRAGNIEVEVIYDVPMLQVRVRDDGEGIDATVLGAGGRPAHFGLIGMRERAKRLGGHVEVWSKPGAGTEVDLRVPASVAYREPLSASRNRIQSRLTNHLVASKNRSDSSLE